MGKTIIIKYNTKAYSVKIPIKFNFCVFTRFKSINCSILALSLLIPPTKRFLSAVFLWLYVLNIRIKNNSTYFAIEYEKTQLLSTKSVTRFIRKNTFSYCWYYLISLPPLSMKNLSLMQFIYSLLVNHHLLVISYLGSLQPLQTERIPE